MEQNQFIAWQEEYCVGNSILDRQHQFVVHSINRLYETRMADGAEAALDALLDSLYQYTKTHFAYEERLLETASFPELESHRALHRRMEAKTLELKEHCLAGKRELTEELFRFLKDWWLGHILQEDFGYRPFLGRG